VIKVNGVPLSLVQPEILRTKGNALLKRPPVLVTDLPPSALRLSLFLVTVDNLDVARLQSRSPSSSSALTASLTSTSASVSTVVVALRVSMLSVRPLPRASLLSTRSLSTRHPRRRSRTPSSLTTARSSLPTPAAASPRSSVDPVPAHATRSRTVKKKSQPPVDRGRFLLSPAVFLFSVYVAIYRQLVN